MAKRDLNVGLVLDTRAFDKALGATQRKLNRFAFQAQSIGRNLTQSFSIPLALAGAAGIKLATDLEASFAKIENLVGITGDTLDSFKTSVKELSGEVGKSQQELSEALFVVTSAGVRGSEALDILAQSAKASVVGLGETKDIARAVTSAMQAYAKEGLTAADATDTLTAIVKEGNLEAEALAGSLGAVLPVAAQLGVSFQEVGANIAAFTRLGVSSEEAATALKGLLAGLLKPADQTINALKGVGLTTQQLRDDIKSNGLASTLNELIAAFDGNVEVLGDVFPNIRALSSVLGTAGAQGEEYIKIVDSITGSTGLVDKAFESASQTMESKLNKAFVNIKNLAIDFGNVLLPVVSEWVTKINQFSARFSSLSEGSKKTIVSVSLVVAAIGPLIFVIGKTISVAASLVQGLRLLTQGFAFLVNGIGKAIKAFRALDFASKLTVIGLVTVAIAGLYLAFKGLTSGMRAAKKESEAIKSIQEEIATTAAAEQAELKKLIGVVEDVTQADETRQAALNKLQEIYPNYFSNLDLENIKVGTLESKYDELTKKIKSNAVARAKDNKLSEITQRQIEAELRIQELQEKGFDALTRKQKLYRDAAFVEGRKRGSQTETGVPETGKEYAVRREIQLLEGNVKSLDVEAQKLNETFDKLYGPRKEVKGSFGGGGRLGGSIETFEEVENIKAIVLGYEQQVKRISETGGDLKVPKLITATRVAISDLSKQTTDTDPKLIALKKSLAAYEAIKPIEKNIDVKTSGAGKEIKTVISVLEDYKIALKSIGEEKQVGLIPDDVPEAIKATETALADLLKIEGPLGVNTQKLAADLETLKGIYRAEIEIKANESVDIDSILRNLDNQLKVIESKKIVGLIGSGVLDSIKVTEKALQDLSVAPGVTSEEIDKLNTKLAEFKGVYEAEIKLSTAELTTAGSVITNLNEKLKLISRTEEIGLISDTAPDIIKATEAAFKAMVVVQGETGAETLILKTKLESLKGEYTARFNLDIQTGDIGEVDTIFEDLQAELDDIELKASISLVDDSEAEKLSALESALYKVAKATSIDSTDFQNLKTQVDEARNSTNGLSESLQSAFKDIEFNAEIFDVPQLDVLKQKLEAVKTQMQSLNPEENAERLAVLKTQYDELNESIENSGTGLAGLVENLNKTEVAMQGFYGAWDKAASLVKTALKEQTSVFAAIGQAALASALDVVRAELQKTVATLIFKIVAKVPFPFNLALAAGAGALVSGIFTAAISKLGIPGLAHGGVIPPGFPNDSYPAFLTSGETVIPPGKLPDFATSGIIAETRINGRDLLIMLRREESSLSRIE